jgi:hypothetical protein
VLTTLANGRRTTRDAQAAAFEVVGVMRSDYDRAETLLAFVSGLDASTRPAFVAAAQQIKSSYDQNRVLAALVKAEGR